MSDNSDNSDNPSYSDDSCFSDNISEDNISEDNSDIETYICSKFHNINENGSCQVTWELAMRDSSIKSIQEPISEMLICKREFNDAYSKFMITLDGRDMTSYVDFFWRRSAIDNSCLEFIDKDTRLDIYEYFRDDNLVPDMAKVHSGDWKFNK